MAIAQYLTVRQVASALALSHDTVLRQFASFPGVIDVGTAETMHKRRRRELRIPQAAFEAWVESKQVRTRKATR